MSNVKKPEPFGYARDGNLGGGLVFQHKISEMDALVSSTMPLYSPDQMDSYANGRVREALEKAASILDRMYVNALKAKVPTAEDDESWNLICTAQARSLTEARLKVKALTPKQ